MKFAARLFMLLFCLALGLSFMAGPQWFPFQGELVGALACAAGITHFLARDSDDLDKPENGRSDFR